MRCRFCDKELVQGEDQVYETLCDHVSDPNNTNLPARITFVCPDSKCIANEVKGFWDDLGEFYKVWNTKVKLPTGLYSAMDSHARQMEIEIYKKDENFTFWKGWKYHLKIEFSYKADTNGKILKRTPKVVILRKEFDSIKDMFKRKKPRCLIHHSTNLSMFFFCKEDYIRKMDRLKTAVAEKNIEAIIPSIKEIHRAIDQSRDYQDWYVWRHIDYKKIIYGDFQWYRPLYRHWIVFREIEDLKYIEDTLEELQKNEGII